MEKIEELKIKKLIKEYEYLLTEYEFRKEYSDRHKPIFLSEISKRRRELGINEPQLVLPPPILEEISEEEVNEEDENEESLEEKNLFEEKEKRLKAVYREIVKVCHPDKIINKSQRKHFTDIYIKSKGFLVQKNILGLYLVCVELGINLEIKNFDENEVKPVVEQKKSEIQAFESSYLWMWINAEIDKKIEVVDLFIKNNG